MSDTNAMSGTNVEELRRAPAMSAGAGVARSSEWCSDVVANLLRDLGIPFVALSPGSSFRGLHESLVNVLGNRDPEMLLCLHEEHAVAVAHGWAKVTGQPMGVLRRGADHLLPPVRHRSVLVDIVPHPWARMDPSHDMVNLKILRCLTLSKRSCDRLTRMQAICALCAGGIFLFLSESPSGQIDGNTVTVAITDE